MLHFRRNHGTSSLLQDATRAGSRIADETRGVAQTARAEIGGLGREVRGQAGDGLVKARRRTARGLESAASAVDQGKRKRRGRKPLLFAVLAGVIGWVAVRASRSGAPKADEVVDEAGATASKATERAATEVAGAAGKVEEEADDVRKAAKRQHAKTGSNNAAN